MCAFVNCSHVSVAECVGSVFFMNVYCSTVCSMTAKTDHSLQNVLVADHIGIGQPVPKTWSKLRERAFLSGGDSLPSEYAACTCGKWAGWSLRHRKRWTVEWTRCYLRAAVLPWISIVWCCQPCLEQIVLLPCCLGWLGRFGCIIACAQWTLFTLSKVTCALVPVS